MDSFEELQKKVEINFLKNHSYEQINDMFRTLKNKLNEAESKIKSLEEQLQQNKLRLTDDCPQCGGSMVNIGLNRKQCRECFHAMNNI